MAITIPNTFADKTGQVQLEALDENFSQIASDLNTEVTAIQNEVDAALNEVQAAVESIEDPVAMSLLFGPDPIPGVEPGSVIQAVQNHVDTPLAQSITAYTLTGITGLTATITPKSSTSSILVMARWWGETSVVGNTWDSMFGLSRNGTPVGSPGAGSSPGLRTTGISSSALSYYLSDANSTPEMMSFQYIDSPATTSAITYQITYIANATSTLYTNRTVGDINTAASYERGTSSLILLEIAG